MWIGLTVLLVITACGGEDGPTDWPQGAASAHARLIENEELLVSLKDEIHASKYELLLLQDPGEINALYEHSGRTEWEVPNESPEWSELFAEIGLNSVNRSEDYYMYMLDSNFDDDGNLSIFHIILRDSYRFTPNDPYQLKICDESFESIPCGACDVYRSGKWTIQAVWMSGIYDSNENPSYREDEYYQCIEAGFEELGYGKELLWFLD